MADKVAQCHGKQAFESPHDAAKAVKRLRRNKEAKGYHGLEPYRCPRCSRWHLGNPLRTSKQTLRTLYQRFQRRHLAD